jgi:hypothetical protein
MLRLRIIRLLFLSVAAQFVAADAVFTQTDLWGKAGDAWDPKGILPDFSFAGYQRGEQSIPDRTPSVSVSNFGAKPDTDATQAFQKAIDENPGKCIEIPAGRFVISDRLKIPSSETVLKGAGSRITTLYFTRSLQEVEPKIAQTTSAGEPISQWSWSGGFIVVGNSSVESTAKLRISGESERGDVSLNVAELNGIEVGYDVLIEVSDDEGGTLTDYLYRGTPGDHALIKGQTSIRQVARVLSIEGDRLTIDRPLRCDIRLRWKPTIQKFVPKVENCGLEGVAIEFPSRPYRGHFKEDGYNAVELRGTNNFLRDIAIKNADSGMFIYGQFNTVDGVVVTADRTAHQSGNTGHHGLFVAGQDCLVTNFRIRTKFYHDLTVSKGSVGNVFSAGSGSDLNFDHHRFAPYENLFTNINLGRGTRPWDSGGTRGKGRFTASGATFWNIDSRNKIVPPQQDFGPRDIIFVGLNARDSGVASPTVLPGGWYYERQRPGRFEPADLHQAQLQRRLKGVSRGTSRTTDPSREAPEN